jgi:hypothetical protein
MPISRRQDLRIFLKHFFNAISSEVEVEVEDCLNAYITSRLLDTQYMLKSSEIKTSSATSKPKRLTLRSQVSQELGLMKQMGLVGRLRYGVYIRR